MLFIRTFDFVEGGGGGGDANTLSITYYTVLVLLLDVRQKRIGEQKPAE